MDLLFKRYASPFCYIDVLLENGALYDGVLNIWEEYNNDKAWEMYLSYNPNNSKSFEDWKEDIKNKAQAKEPLSKAQVGATVKKSQNILKSFNPLKNKQNNKE